MHRGDDQIALVLAAVIIGHDNDFAGLEGADGVDDTLLVIGHGALPEIEGELLTAPRVS
ncbi:hypothetical protein D9M70_639070 [compost metagenome]